MRKNAMRCHCVRWIMPLALMVCISSRSEASGLDPADNSSSVVKPGDTRHEEGTQRTRPVADYIISEVKERLQERHDEMVRQNGERNRESLENQFGELTILPAVSRFSDTTNEASSTETKNDPPIGDWNCDSDPCTDYWFSELTTDAFEWIDFRLNEPVSAQDCQVYVSPIDLDSSNSNDEEGNLVVYPRVRDRLYIPAASRPTYAVSENSYFDYDGAPVLCTDILDPYANNTPNYPPIDIARDPSPETDCLNGECSFPKTITMTCMCPIKEPVSGSADSVKYVDPCNYSSDGGTFYFSAAFGEVDGSFLITVYCGESEGGGEVSLTINTRKFNSTTEEDKEELLAEIDCSLGRLRPTWRDLDNDGFADVGAEGEGAWQGYFCDRTPTICDRAPGPDGLPEASLCVATSQSTAGDSASLPNYMRDTNPNAAYYPGALTYNRTDTDDYSLGIATSRNVYGTELARVNPLSWHPDTGKCFYSDQAPGDESLSGQIWDTPGVFMRGDKALSGLGSATTEVGGRVDFDWAENAGKTVACLDGIAGGGFGAAVLVSSSTSNQEAGDAKLPDSRAYVVFGGHDIVPGVHRLNNRPSSVASQLPGVEIPGIPPGSEIFLDLDGRITQDSGMMLIEADGTNSFGEQVFSLDMNNDGDADLAFSDSDRNKIHVFYGPFSDLLSQCPSEGMDYANPWCDVTLDGFEEECTGPSECSLRLKVRRDYIPAISFRGEPSSKLIPSISYAAIVPSSGGQFHAITTGDSGLVYAEEEASTGTQMIRIPSLSASLIFSLDADVTGVATPASRVASLTTADLDGDGQEDLIAGVAEASTSEGKRWCSAIWYGPFSSESPYPSATICAEQPNDRIGESLTTLPSWESHGNADVIALGETARSDYNPTNCQSINGGQDVACTAGVYLMGWNNQRLQGGYTLFPPRDGDPAPLLLERSSLIPHAPDTFAYISGPLGSSFGHQLSNAGDVDGDGFDDLFIGQHSVQNLPEEHGTPIMVTLWLHDDSAWSASGVTRLWSTADAVFASDLGYNSNDQASIGQGCDLNRDGYDDFLIGLPSFVTPFNACVEEPSPTANMLTGGAWVFYGHGEE